MSHTNALETFEVLPLGYQVNLIFYHQSFKIIKLHQILNNTEVSDTMRIWVVSRCSRDRLDVSTMTDLRIILIFVTLFQVKFSNMMISRDFLKLKSFPETHSAEAVWDLMTVTLLRNPCHSTVVTGWSYESHFQVVCF